MREQENILKWFEKGKSLTVLIALQKFHTTELRKIVSRLRKKGYRIDSEYQYTDEKRFKRYWLHSK